VSEQRNDNDRKKRPFSGEKGLNAEQVALFIGLFCFIIFLWLVAILLVSIVSGRPSPVALSPRIVEIAATQGFVLPPTWTPTPEQTVIPTPVPTQVWDGQVPTRIYTPRPTSLPGLPFPFFPSGISVVDLARIMQGESPGDKEAAYMVGWVAKNRLMHAGYGDTYAVVSHGFFGYRADMQPNEDFLALARQVIRTREDPTGGCLYALSRTDITKLGVPPSRADVAYGEWFFFRTWPLNGR
jgi:hypothetical protein